MQRAVEKDVRLPSGYSVSWSGQFEYLQRAKAKLSVVVPFTLLIIIRSALPHLPSRRRSAFSSWQTLPFALIGGFWFIYLLGHQISVATIVGFIALAGVAADLASLCSFISSMRGTRS